MRLAIISTHPIQYNAPLFRELAGRDNIDIKVFYNWEGTANQKDPEFGQKIAWDIPLLDGYDWEMVPNRAPDPGTHHFGGLDNPDMIQCIEAWKPDAVLVYGWAWKTHLRVMRYFKGRVPVLFRGDSTLLSATGPVWKKWLRRPALWWIYRHMDIALSPGIRNREYLLSIGVKPEQIVWMPHAVETARFCDPAIQPEAEAAREALGIGAGDIVFLFAGKFVPRKECGLLIDAFKATSAGKATSTGRADMHLLLAGDGPLRENLEQQARDMPNIHFLGFQNQSEMPMIYRMGDVFVLPSKVETWGLGLNEAIASGCAVIASDHVGAAPDLVDGKEYGVVFRSGNPKELQAALLHFQTSRNSHLEVGNKGARESKAWAITAAADAIETALSNLPVNTS